MLPIQLTRHVSIARGIYLVAACAARANMRSASSSDLFIVREYIYVCAGYRVVVARISTRIRDRSPCLPLRATPGPDCILPIYSTLEPTVYQHRFVPAYLRAPPPRQGRATTVCVPNKMSR